MQFFVQLPFLFLLKKVHLSKKRDNGYMYLKQLREALQREMNIEQDGKKMAAA